MSTPHARNIVRRLLAGGKSLRVQELYSRGLAEYPATPFPPPPPSKQYTGKKGVLKPAPPQPPNPGHPFRSHSYLKDKVLTELVATGEIEKYHTLVEASPNASLPKRRTKSKKALENGGEDAWFWRLTGNQAKEPEPRMEEEPEPDSHDWHAPNVLFPRIGKVSMRDEPKRDPYGAGRLDHLNTRRQNARPEKEKQEREWRKYVAMAREEGTIRASERN